MMNTKNGYPVQADGSFQSRSRTPFQDLLEGKIPKPAMQQAMDRPTHRPGSKIPTTKGRYPSPFEQALGKDRKGRPLHKQHRLWEREARKRALRAARLAGSLGDAFAPGPLQLALEVFNPAEMLLALTNPNAFGAFDAVHSAAWTTCKGPCASGQPPDTMLGGANGCATMNCNVLQSTAGYTQDVSRWTAPQWNAYGQYAPVALGGKMWMAQTYLISGGLERADEFKSFQFVGPNDGTRPRFVPGHFRNPQIHPWEQVKARTAPALGPPNLPRDKPTLPSRRKDEKKKGLAQKGYAIAAGVYDQADEFLQALVIAYNSIPPRHRCGGKQAAQIRGQLQTNLGVGHMAACIAKKAGHMRLNRFIAGIVYNSFEDSLSGQFHGHVSKATRPHMGGRSGGLGPAL